MASAPARSVTPSSDAARSPSSESHEVSAPRRRGRSSRAVEWCHSGSARPFEQVYPRETGWSRSPRTRSTRSPSTDTTMPHAAAQIRQNDGCSWSTGALYGSTVASNARTNGHAPRVEFETTVVVRSRAGSWMLRKRNAGIAPFEADARVGRIQPEPESVPFAGGGFERLILDEPHHRERGETLVPLASPNRVSGVFGRRCTRSANPYAASNATSAPTRTETTPEKSVSRASPSTVARRSTGVMRRGYAANVR